MQGKATTKVFKALKSMENVRNFGVTTNRVDNRHAANISQSLISFGIKFDKIDFKVDSPVINGAMFTGSSKKGILHMCIYN